MSFVVKLKKFVNYDARNQHGDEQRMTMTTFHIWVNSSFNRIIPNCMCACETATEGEANVAKQKLCRWNIQLPAHLRVIFILPQSKHSQENLFLLANTGYYSYLRRFSINSFNFPPLPR